MNSALYSIGSAILVAAAIPSVLFVLIYARSRWEETQIGRQTMALSFVIALILTLSVFRIFFAESPWYVAIRLAAFVLIVPTLWWRLGLLLRTQREGVHSGGNPDEEGTQ